MKKTTKKRAIDIVLAGMKEWQRIKAESESVIFRLSISLKENFYVDRK